MKLLSFQKKYILKLCILYDLDQQPGIFDEKFEQILKRLFVE